MILDILGIVLLILLLVGAYYGWKVYRFFKTQSSSDVAIAMSVLPAQEMTLEPSNNEEWIEKEQLAFQEKQLKSIGAEHLGYFIIYSDYAIVRLSLWTYKSAVVAAIYEASSEQDKHNASFMFEVASKINGGSVCITSNHTASTDSRPPNHILHFNDSNKVLDFIKDIKSKIPNDNKILKIADAKSFFIECYEDTTEWSWREEQLQSSKTHQVLQSVGVDVTDELISELVELGKTYSVEINVNRVRKKLAKNSNISAEQWERMRDQLVIVNELMEIEDLLDAVYQSVGELTESQDLLLDGFEENSQNLVDPLAAFQLLVQTLNLQIKRIAQIDGPVKSEVYLPLKL